MPTPNRGTGAPDAAHSNGQSALVSAALFGLLWQTLSEVLGTAAAATLLRRACKRAALRSPVLRELAIFKSELAYTFTTPDQWSRDAAAPPEGMRALVAELRPLLVELTGPVLVRRIEGLTEFQQRGIIDPQGAPK